MNRIIYYLEADLSTTLSSHPLLLRTSHRQIGCKDRAITAINPDLGDQTRLFQLYELQQSSSMHQLFIFALKLKYSVIV